MSNNWARHDPERLLDRARAGDDSALLQLLDDYRPYLVLLARVHIDRHLQAKVDGSDLVQETLICARRDFATFRGTSEEELTTWLRAIMAHLGANLVRHYRSQRRDVRREQAFHEQLDQSSRAIGRAVADPQSSPSEKAVRRERAVLVACALDRLPENQREVVILHEFEGNTIQEIADRVGRSANSVQKLWARALIQLHQWMKDQL